MTEKVSEKTKGLIVSLFSQLRKEGFDVKTNYEDQACLSVFVHDWEDKGEHVTIHTGKPGTDHDIDFFIPAGTVLDKGGSSDGRKENHAGIA